MRILWPAAVLLLAAISVTATPVAKTLGGALGPRTPLVSPRHNSLTRRLPSFPVARATSNNHNFDKPEFHSPFDFLPSDVAIESRKDDNAFAISDAACLQARFTLHDASLTAQHALKLLAYWTTNRKKWEVKDDDYYYAIVELTYLARQKRWFTRSLMQEFKLASELVAAIRLYTPQPDSGFMPASFVKAIKGFQYAARNVEWADMIMAEAVFFVIRRLSSDEIEELVRMILPCSEDLEMHGRGCDAYDDEVLESVLRGVVLAIDFMSPDVQLRDGQILLISLQRAGVMLGRDALGGVKWFVKRNQHDTSVNVLPVEYPLAHDGLRPIPMVMKVFASLLDNNGTQ